MNVEQKNKASDFLPYLQAAAALNHADTQVDLGLMYLYGYKDIEANPETAISYLEPAVLNNRPKACAYLATLYLEYYPQKPIKDIYEILLKGSQLGSPESNALLGYLCQKGDIPNAGEEQAQYYLTLAEQKGNYEGYVLLFEYYQKQAKEKPSEQESLIQQSVTYLLPALHARANNAIANYQDLIKLSENQDLVAKRTLEIIHAALSQETSNSE